MFLDFDPSVLEITGISMPNHGDEEPYYIVKDNILQIGWASLTPVMISGAETFLTIRARVKDLHTDHVRFTVNTNPLSEVANSEGVVIESARLFIADASSVTDGSRRPK